MPIAALAMLVGTILPIFMSAVPASAAPCSGSDVTITRQSSAAFYVDTGYQHRYVAYSITTSASKSYTDLYVTWTNNGSSLAINSGSDSFEDGTYHVGALGTSSTATVYFFLKSTVVPPGNTPAGVQNYNLNLYNGTPVGGTAECTSAQSNTSIETNGFANSNKVTSVNYSAPYLGSNFTMTVIGDTGQIGAGRLFSYSPAALGKWNADCMELRDTSIVLTGGNTGTINSKLLLTVTQLPNATDTHYVITYTFTAKCVTNSSTPVAPLSYVSSGGSGLNHTNTSGFASLPPIAPATNSLAITKSVSPASSTSGGTATYYVNLTNSGPSSASIDDFVDTLPSSPANATYIAGTSKYDTDISDGVAAATISNPTGAGQTKTWTRTFTVDSGKTAQLSYNVTIPSNAGSYINSVIGHSGTTVIDQTVDTTDNSPATATYGVGSLSMAGSTKTGSDINGGSLQPGDTIEYTIVADAAGTDDATGVLITDTIDTNTENITNVVVGAQATDCGASYINSSTSTVLTISGVNVSHGSFCIITFQVTVKASAASGTTILNTATVDPANTGGITGTPSSTPMVVRKDPILSITNTENDSDNVVIAGQVITYTITIRNTGQATANGVDLTATIAGPVGSLSARTITNCGSDYVDTSATLTLNIAALSVTTASNCVITYTVAVNGGATSGSVTNSVDITAAREGGNNPDAVSASTLLIGAAPTPPNLSVAVTENDVDNFVNPGQSVLYAITISNSGQTDATSSLTSVIPTGMGSPSTRVYSNCGTPSSSYSAPTLSITSLSIAAANSCTITFTVVVISPLDENTPLTLVVDVAAASQGGNNPASINATTLLVDATPILAVTFTENDADNIVNPNQAITYTLTITNTGNGSATIVGALDSIVGSVGNPSNFSFTDCGASYSNNSVSSFNVIDLTISTSTPCIVTYQVSVASNAANASTIANSIDVSAAAEGGENPVPVAATTLTVSTPPNLVVAMTENDADNSVTPGQSILFTITIQNTGGTSASTSLASIIPNGMAAPSGYNYSQCGSPNQSYNAPTLTVTSIIVGQGTTCTITFSSVVASPLNEGTTLIAQTDVAASPEGGNDPASVSASTLTVDSTPTLGVVSGTNDADNIVSPGQNVTYSTTITNTGNGQATGVSLTDSYTGPVGSLGTFNLTNCGSSSTNNSSSSVNITGLIVDVGTPCIVSYRVTINLNATGSATVNNSADVSAATEGGNNPAAVQAPQLVVSVEINLALSSTENDADNFVTPSQTVTYTLELDNNSTTDASGITVTDVITGVVGSISNVQLTDCGNQYSNTTSGKNLTISGISVIGLATCQVNYDVVVASDAAAGATISNAADATAAAEGGNNPVPTSTSTLTVASVPNLSVIITENDSDNFVVPSQSVSFTMTIANSGNGSANTSATIAIPSGIGSVANVNFSQCGSANYSIESASIVISGLTITNTDDCVITFTAVVDSPNTEGKSIILDADVAQAAEGGNNPASVSTDEITVDTTPDFSTSTSTAVDLNDGSLKPGDQISNTITLINTGNGKGTGLQISSLLDENLTLDVNSIVLENCGLATIDTSDSGQLFIEGIDVELGTNCVITFTTTVRSPVNENTPIGSSVDVSAATEGGDGITLATDEISVDATPNLDIAIDDDGTTPTVAPGQTLNYILTISNLGDGAATTTASIQFPVGLDAPTNIVFTNCGSATSSFGNGVLQLSAITIDTVDMCAISLTSVVSTPNVELRDVALFVDVATATEGGNDPDPQLSPSRIVDITPELTITTIDDDVNNIVNPGETISVTLTISNSGNGTATGVDAAFVLTGDAGTIGTISYQNCGNAHTEQNLDNQLNLSDLIISTTAACQMQFDYSIFSDAEDGSTVTQNASVDQAIEGGNSDTVSGDVLTIDASNTAPNLPANVSTNAFNGNNYVSQTNLDGATITATISDPNVSDQVRFHVQFALDCDFMNPIIDYHLPFSAQGSMTFTFHENTGTYTTGSSATEFVDGSYCYRIRAEDDHGAASSWYTDDAQKFKIDTTGPSKPMAPYLIGDPLTDSADIGWDEFIDEELDPLLPYRLEYSLDPNFDSFTNVDTADLQKTLQGLSPGTRYYVRIYVKDVAGNFSQPSDVLEVLTATSTPDPDPAPDDTLDSTSDLTPDPSQPTRPAMVNTQQKTFVRQQSTGTTTTTTPETVVSPNQPPTTTIPSSIESTKVEIVVEDQNGTRIKDAKVTIHSEPRTGYTDKRGTVTFWDVPIGEHTVIVEYAGKISTSEVTLKSGVTELKIDVVMTNVSVKKCGWWCWLWLLLLLIPMYIYYRYKKRQHQDRKTPQKNH